MNTIIDIVDDRPPVLTGKPARVQKRLIEAIENDEPRSIIVEMYADAIDGNSWPDWKKVSEAANDRWGKLGQFDLACEAWDIFAKREDRRQEQKEKDNAARKKKAAERRRNKGKPDFV